MIHYSNTTVFNTDADTIVNTVNCVGVMGNGLALECRLRYPEMFEDYVGRCRQGEVAIGKPYVFRYPGGPVIINLAVKMHWKYPARLEWVRQGLEGLVALLDSEGIRTLAIPPLGCNLGKLDWEKVEPLMEQYLGPHSCESIICFDSEERASGVEGEMASLLNDSAHLWWVNELRPGRTAVNSILTALPVKHFREVRLLPGVRKQIYEQLHRLLYCRVTEIVLPELRQSNLRQLCLLI